MNRDELLNLGRPVNTTVTAKHDLGQRMSAVKLAMYREAERLGLSDMEVLRMMMQESHMILEKGSGSKQ